MNPPLVIDTEAIRIRAAVAGGQHARDVDALLRALTRSLRENTVLRRQIVDAAMARQQPVEAG